MEDRVRSVCVVMDYSTVIAVSTATLKVLVAILTVMSIVISADITPIGASILDVVGTLGAIFLTGITPRCMALSTTLTPSLVIYCTPIVILGADVITTLTYISAVIAHLVIAI
jgi:hypothetical protein